MSSAPARNPRASRNLLTTSTSDVAATLQGDIQGIPWAPMHAWHEVARPSQQVSDVFAGTRSDASQTDGLVPEQGSVLMMTWPFGRQEEPGEPEACTVCEPCVRKLVFKFKDDTVAILVLAHGEVLMIGQGDGRHGELLMGLRHDASPGALAEAFRGGVLAEASPGGVVVKGLWFRAAPGGVLLEASPVTLAEASPWGVLAEASPV